MNTLRSVAAATLAVTLAGSLGLAGCTTTKPKPTQTNASQSASTRPTLVPKPLPSEAQFDKDPVGASVDVHITACPTDAGKQTAKGKVKNSAKEKRDYSIMIIWLKKDNGTPLGSGLTLVRGVEPGAEAEWSVTSDVITRADLCTQNVKAGQLKS